MKFKINRNRFGIVRSKEFIKLQLGNIRLYITRIPLKPKHESKSRRSTQAEIERIEAEESAKEREARDRAAAEIPVFSVNPVEKPLGAIMHVQV